MRRERESMVAYMNTYFPGVICMTDMVFVTEKCTVYALMLFVKGEIEY